MISILFMILLPCVAIILTYKIGPNIAWAKPAALLCLLLCLGIAVGRIAKSSSGGQGKTIQMAHDYYQDILATQLVGNLKTRHTGGNVVILCPPQQGFNMPLKGEDPLTLTDHLQIVLENEGFNVSLHPLTIPEEAISQFKDQVDPNTDPAILLDTLAADPSLWLSPRALSKLLKTFDADTDLVISTQPFPSGIDSRVLPRRDSKPAIVLLNTSMNNLQEAMEKSALDTIVLNQPTLNKKTASTSILNNPEAAFKERYVFVTKQNVNSLEGTHPLL